MKKLILSILIILPIILLSSCTKDTVNNLDTKNVNEVKINSKADLLSILEKYNRTGYMIGMPENATDDQKAGNPTNDYSRTNTQVNGVDEADIVKTDGTYIYLSSHHAVKIMKAYPTEEMELVETISFDQSYYPTGLYVDGKYLIVIGNYYRFDEERGYYDYYSNTRVFIYEKNHYESPVDTITINGYALTTRKVNEELLIIANQYIYYNPQDEDTLKLPELTINEDTYTTTYDMIHYQENTIPNSFVSLYKFNLNEPLDYHQYTTLGNVNQVYVSQENVYLADYVYYYYQFIDAADEVKENNTTTTTEEKNDVRDTTLITKINYTDENFGESKHVRIKGSVINQFAMDEYQNTFRVATTIGQMWWNNQEMYNRLYIFDENLDELSKIDHIADDERIQSTRFMGERIYIVTFRQVDPFFVIDAKDPSHPEILGELKIPGFSTYLHPYDENHIIGFGFDTVADDEGRVSVTGLKMSLFDVTNPRKPINKFDEIFAYGDSGYAYSQITYDHKALLFSQSKNIIAFPFSSYYSTYENGSYKSYHEQLYKVFNLDLENGFSHATDITHFDEAVENGYQYGYEILRGAYINDVLYTVSYEKMQAHDLTDYTKLAELDLEFDGNYGYWYGPWID